MGKTRLQLARRLRQEARVNGTSSDPISTLNQIGEYLKLVNWLDDAYEAIQNLHENWQFLRESFSVDLSSDIAAYTPTSLSITDHANWIMDDVRCYLKATGVSDEQEIFYMPWEEFKRTYLFGNTQTQTGRPIQFTIKPDKSIQFWPIPDAIYSITGEYYKTAITWSTDATEPVFPDRFHMIVMWRALMFYGANYGEVDQLIHGETEYKKKLSKLQFDQLPRMGWGAPLA